MSGLILEIYPCERRPNFPHKTEALRLFHGHLVQTLQDNRAYIDSLSICTVVRGALGFTDHPTGKILEFVTGFDFTLELMMIGSRIYTLERLIRASSSLGP